jgi:hypothetical protein
MTMTTMIAVAVTGVAGSVIRAVTPKHLAGAGSGTAARALD